MKAGLDICDPLGPLAGHVPLEDALNLAVFAHVAFHSSKMYKKPIKPDRPPASLSVCRFRH
jgi:hypothetical protein